MLADVMTSIIPSPRLLLLVAASWGCHARGAPEQQAPAGPSQSKKKSFDPAAWLVGSVDERFALVGKHLRGFDVAMAEIGYRYTELYWASRDGNWRYARYQLSKIETVVSQAAERRPNRGGTAKMLDGPAQMVKAAIERRDAAGLQAALTTLTATCNACHHAARAEFIHVEPPRERLSPVRLDPAQKEPAAPGAR